LASRNEWFEWSIKVPYEELLLKRTGGTGSILNTLFHIVDSEYSWIRAIEGKPDFMPKYDDYMSVELIENLSKTYNYEVRDFLKSWSSDQETKTVTPSWMVPESFTGGEILRHVIAHEIHHIGQLSIWARELGLNPVSSNFIGRGLVK
jgi:uncharacterized damage-inducible protein DinB